ncbi:YwqJ-like deaminase, partial [Nocardiopsis sp. L17-MgMaSL7]
WGEAAAGTDYGWVRDVGSAVWDFGVGAVEGVGAAVGAHSSEGWFAQSWGDSLKEYHWGNLTSAASLVGMYDAESDSLGWAGLSSAGQAWKDLAHSVVPWEEWGERPGYVIGTALLNIGATVGGAVLTATGVGAVVGVPLMAWRGAAILDGMGSSNRGGGDGGVDLPNLPEVPTYGGNGAPVVNIDTSNMTPTQVAQVTASLDRLNTTSSSGSGSSGESGSGGRPVNARQHTEPTGGDLNRADRVSQNTSTRESGSGNGSRKNDTEKPPNWTSDSGDSVDIKPNRSGSEPEPALVSSRNDGDVLTESKKTPTPVPVRANATDIDTPGSGSRSGNEIADNTRGDRSADVQDNKNSVQNQSEEGPSPSKGGSEDSNDSRFQRDGDGDSATDRNSDQRDHDRNEGDRNESTGHNDDQERVTYTTKPEEGAWSKDLKESYSLDDERVRRLPEPTTIPPGDPRQIPTNLSRGGILERISEDNGYKIERRNGLIETVNGKPLEDFVHQRTLEREKEIKLFTDGEVADNDKRQDRNKKKRSELLIERSNLKDGSKAPGDGTVSVQISRADLGGAKGGVYSLVMDRRTGLLAEGMNGKDKTVRLDPENDLHPHLQDRLEKMTREGGQDSDGNPTDMPHWDDPLRHAEVKALNELLLARKDAKMSDFMLENRFFLKDGPKPDKSTIENESIDEKRTREENIERKKNSPCCANCSRMTDGATSPKSGKLWFMPGDPRNNT